MQWVPKLVIFYPSYFVGRCNWLGFCFCLACFERLHRLMVRSLAMAVIVTQFFLCADPPKVCLKQMHRKRWYERQIDFFNTECWRIDTVYCLLESEQCIVCGRLAATVQSQVWLHMMGLWHLVQSFTHLLKMNAGKITDPLYNFVNKMINFYPHTPGLPGWHKPSFTMAAMPMR